MISLLCVGALVHNLFVLPGISGRALERESEKQVGYSLGMLVYPSILFVLSLLYYNQQVIMAVGWGIMAFGDGFAGWLGKPLGGPSWSWHDRKRLGGTAVFFLLGAPLTLGLVYLLPEASRLGFSLARWSLAIGVATLAAALVESLPGLIDDNFSVPLIGAVTCHLMLHIPAVPVLPEAWPTGLTLVLLLTVFSIVSKKIDVPGGLTGAILSGGIFLGGGLASLSLLFVFFFAGTFASKWKIGEKVKLGLAQENSGRRSMRHAVANGGMAAACGLLAWFFPDEETLYLGMLAASMASATADTLSSEFGNLYGRRFVNVLTLKPERRGLDGVISLEGTLIGAIGSLAIGIVTLLWGASLPFALAVAAAGVFGNWIDSVLGATLQRRGLMNNDTVNAANTIIAGLFFQALYLALM
ncbi:MAG: DUF92 domain-containing protein [Acidobacteriota bacterium]|nr:DUF92 domain-containing protein [Acidobacteriota bacterium]